tara:strand:+ start:365 stop:649 length:285 start_codon:yes stop_codon:yes gene_type:complete
MRNILSITLFFLINSCDSKKNTKKSWNDEDKDIVYKECISYSQVILNYENNMASKYCDCLTNNLFQKYADYRTYYDEAQLYPTNIFAEMEICKN